MKKWVLILLISLWVLFMVAFAGGYDGRKTAVASRNYREAPSEITRSELHAAKRSDRWHILICELVMGALLIWPVISLVRLSNREP
jgi:hypothetical protein